MCYGKLHALLLLSVARYTLEINHLLKYSFYFKVGDCLLIGFRNLDRTLVYLQQLQHHKSCRGLIFPRLATLSFHLFIEVLSAALNFCFPPLNSLLSFIALLSFYMLYFHVWTAVILWDLQRSTWLAIFTSTSSKVSLRAQWEKQSLQCEAWLEKVAFMVGTFSRHPEVQTSKTLLMLQNDWFQSRACYAY